MGHGYHILIWDDWGAGLVMLNPRLHAEGVDMYGNPLNWWSCAEHDTDDTLAARHPALLTAPHYRLLRS